MLSKSCEYAIRGVAYIALNSEEDKRIGIKEIADELDLPAPFLAKILQTLVKAKILTSIKGPNGGFLLNRNPQKVTLLDVVEIIDGIETFRKCAIGLKKCSDHKPCPIHSEAKIYRDGLREVLAQKTLDKVIESIKTHKAFI
jgi:Rrf2 family protein